MSTRTRAVASIAKGRSPIVVQSRRLLEAGPKSNWILRPTKNWYYPPSAARYFTPTLIALKAAISRFIEERALPAALDALARENPKVKQTLERMLTGGAWSGVVLAAAPIAFAVAGHHILPLFGKAPLAQVPVPPQGAEAVDPHRPVPPGQQARQESGWNEAFAHGVAPEEVFGGTAGA